MSQSKVAGDPAATLISDKTAAVRQVMASSARELGGRACIEACAKVAIATAVEGAQAEAISALLLSRRSAVFSDGRGVMALAERA